MKEGAQEGPVALLDWDATLCDGHSMNSWVPYLSSRGAFTLEAARTLEKLLAGYQGGTISYDAFVAGAAAAYGKGIAGQQVEVIRAHARSFARENAGCVYPFVRHLVSLVGSRGIRPVIVSGSAHEVIEAYGAVVGIPDAHGITIEAANGIYTGQVLENPALANVKRDIAGRYQEAPVLLAAGDSPADLPLLDAAPCRIAVGNPALVAADSRTFHFDPVRGRVSDLLNFLSEHLPHARERALSC